MGLKFGLLQQSLRRFLQQYKQDWWIILAMIVVTILISAPVYAQQAKVMQNDYSAHIQFAQVMLNRQFQDVPLAVFAHPIYQILLIGLYTLAFHRVDLYALAILVQVIMQVLTVLIAYLWFGRTEKKSWNWSRAAWAVTLIIVAPVMVFVFWDKLYYLGYIGLANFHNPTILLLRPVAIASFICAVRIFSSANNTWKFTLLAAFLMILSALIKPNFAICILPALALAVGIRLIWRKPIDWRLLLFGFFLPGVFILLAQLIITYSLSGETGDKILFSFLVVMKGYSDYLLPKLFLSILFPLSVLVFNLRKVSRDNTLLLAWLGFLISLVQTYFLAEGGDRLSDGNFLWGSQIMLFILFAASVRYLWREKIATGLSIIGRKEVIVYIAYAAHLCAGLVYYAHAITITSRSPF